MADVDLQAEDLRPYASVIATRIIEGSRQAAFEQTLHQLPKALGLESGDVEIRDGPRPLDSTQGEEHGLVVYREKRRPSWVAPEAPEDLPVFDTEHHLVLVSRRLEHVVVYISDARRRRRLVGAIGGDILSSLRLVHQEKLEALLQGPLRTLWLAGTHRSVDTKADSKVLAGRDLRFALSPLGDQTFYYNAARAHLPSLGQSVGISPKQSRIWAGPTKDWEDYKASVRSLVDILRATGRARASPIPVLAIPYTSATGVSGAHEMLIQPPELFSDTPGSLSKEAHDALQAWAYDSRFEVEGSKCADLTAEAYLRGVHVATLSLTVDISDPQKADIRVEGEKAEGADDGEYASLLDVCNASYLKVYYTSGQTLSSGALYNVRHRDQPFEGFEWADLNGYKPYREKPYVANPQPKENNLDFGRIGQDGSLFCWVYNHWPDLSGAANSHTGWLTTDDGAGEIADFVHLSEEADPTLTLIHIKSCSKSKQRKLAVTPYEQVVSQAIKNLRYLDSLNSSDALETPGKLVRDLVWRDGVTVPREEMTEQIRSLGGRYRRKVVVLQPHVQKAHYEHVREQLVANPKTTLQQPTLLRLLDTLLLAARASCAELGAELLVVGEHTAPPRPDG